MIINLPKSKLCNLISQDFKMMELRPYVILLMKVNINYMESLNLMFIYLTLQATLSKMQGFLI